MAYPVLSMKTTAVLAFERDLSPSEMKRTADMLSTIAAEIIKGEPRGNPVWIEVDDMKGKPYGT